MGKTYKDKANHFLHHLKPEIHSRILQTDKGKQKYTKDDIPNDVKDKVDLLNKNHGTALRSGNNRKWLSEQKIKESRVDRKDNNIELKQEIKKLKM